MAQRAPIGLRAGAAMACLEAATAAPSIYNTQPWRFRIGTAVLEVFADRSRQLGVIDPPGREMLISVGAAVLNLRIAVLANGRLPITSLLPGNETDLVARVGIGSTIEPTHTVQALAEAVPKRRTNRAPYATTVIPLDVIEELQAAAAVEGATLRLLDPVRRNAAFALALEAQRMDDDPSYLSELAQWTASGVGRHDGVSPSTAAYQDETGLLPLRDFGAAYPPERIRVVKFEAHPQIAVLSTHGDAPLQWLRAGQALQRVLLTATVRSLSAQPITQPLEVPRLRRLLADPDRAFFPQVVLRLGYGPPVGGGAPRRPISDVVMSPL
jgi:nitroreductase